MQKTKGLLIRPPDELKEQLKCASKKRGLTLNGLILQILWDWLKSEQHQEPA